MSRASFIICLKSSRFCAFLTRLLMLSLLQCSMSSNHFLHKRPHLLTPYTLPSTTNFMNITAWKQAFHLLRHFTLRVRCDGWFKCVLFDRNMTETKICPVKRSVNHKYDNRTRLINAIAQYTYVVSASSTPRRWYIERYVST